MWGFKDEMRGWGALMGMWAAGADPKRGALAPKCCLLGGAVSRAPQKGAVFAFRTGLFFSPLRSLRISILPFIVLPKIRCFSLRFWSLPPLPPLHPLGLFSRSIGVLFPPYTLGDFFHALFGSFSPLALLRTFFALHSGLVSPHPFLPFPLTLCTSAPPSPPHPIWRRCVSLSRRAAGPTYPNPARSRHPLPVPARRHRTAARVPARLRRRRRHRAVSAPLRREVYRAVCCY